MTEEISGEVTPPTIAVEDVECRVCREKIKAGARKCIHCDSFQNWLSFVPVSSTILSLLVALVGVSSALIPQLQRAFTPQRSELAFRFQSASLKVVSRFVSNGGSRPASVASGWLVIGNGKRGNTSEQVELSLVRSNVPIDAVVVPPGQSELLFFAVRSTTVLRSFKKYNGLSLISDASLSCRIGYRFTNFMEPNAITEEPIRCQELSAFVDAHQQ